MFTICQVGFNAGFYKKVIDKLLLMMLRKCMPHRL